MSEINIEPIDALRQAGMTTEHYMGMAYKILQDGDYKCETANVIELCKVMAQDFNTVMMCMKMQEIRDVINLLAEETRHK